MSILLAGRNAGRRLHSFRPDATDTGRGAAYILLIGLMACLLNVAFGGMATPLVIPWSELAYGSSPTSPIPVKAAVLMKCAFRALLPAHALPPQEKIRSQSAANYAFRVIHKCPRPFLSEFARNYK
jgi:hypothetical protein